MRQKKTERNRKRETDRQKDREGEGERERERERGREREGERLRERERGREAEGESVCAKSESFSIVFLISASVPRCMELNKRTEGGGDLLAEKLGNALARY
jgi:uncharacterized membrane protein YdbT with pleckstrin-like domain